ncbi:MAG: hypothetical protein ACK58T_43075, partial [Phycisphaerae bacterium]
MVVHEDAVGGGEAHVEPDLSVVGEVYQTILENEVALSEVPIPQVGPVVNDQDEIIGVAAADA